MGCRRDSIGGNGQVTYFVIFGLIIVAFFVIVGSITYKAKTSAIDNRLPDMNFNNVKSSAYHYIDGCLRELTNQAIVKYGLRDTEALMETYIVDNWNDCVDLSIYHELGYEVSISSPISDVRILEESVISDMTYRFILKKGRDVTAMERFSYTFQRTNYLVSADSTVEDDFILPLSDGDAIVKVNQGTIIYDRNSVPIDVQLTVRSFRREFPPLHDLIVVSDIGYDFKPDGAQFSKPIEFSVSYEDEDLPEGSSEDNLRIMWYQEETEMWFLLPTAVDKVNHRLTANLTHFSSYFVGVHSGQPPPPMPIDQMNLEALQEYYDSLPDEAFTFPEISINLETHIPGFTIGSGKAKPFYFQTPTGPMILGIGADLSSKLTQNCIEGQYSCQEGSASYWQALCRTLGIPSEAYGGNVFEFIRGMKPLLDAATALLGLVNGDYGAGDPQYANLIDMLTSNIDPENQGLFEQVLDELLTEGSIQDPDVKSAMEKMYESGGAAKAAIENTVKDKIKGSAGSTAKSWYEFGKSLGMDPQMLCDAAGSVGNNCLDPECSQWTCQCDNSCPPPDEMNQQV